MTGYGKSKIELPNGYAFELPDISYEMFSDFIFKDGFSDIEYEKHLRSKGMQDAAADYEFPLTGAVLTYEADGRVLKFKCVFDSKAKEYKVDEN